MFDVEKVRQDFPILTRAVQGHPLVYLDSAATTLKPKQVVDAVSEHYLYGASNIHRGVHYLSEKATTQYEGVRSKTRQFLGAAEDEEIIFTSGTTQAINFIARACEGAIVGAGDEILISQMEHHSNIVPWQMLAERSGAHLRVIPMDETGTLDLQAYGELLSERTKIVSVVCISNSLGTINPVKKMTEMAHAVGALVLLDGAQAVSHQKINVQDLGCDFFVFSAHKLFGPTGCGVLYGKRAKLEALPPFQGGGDMVKTVSFAQTTYADLPARHEAGTPNIAGVIGLGAALDYVENVGIENIAAHKDQLLKYGTDTLQSIDGLRIIGTAEHKSSILSFVLPGIHPHDIGTIVDQSGIAIRTGHHCTQPVMAFFGVPATARASLSVYNTRSDIDRLVEALYKVKELFL